MSLATRTEGAGGTPLLIAHGLYGSARNWGVIAKRLSDRGQVTAVDMRNHGQSFWDDDHSYPALGDDLAEVVEDQWDVLGHSMGGKASMALALRHPDKVRRLVVADIAPVGYDHSQQQFIDAMRALDLSGLESRRDADSRFAELVHDDGVRAFLLQSLDLEEKRWRLNLDTLEAQMADIVGWPDDLEGPFERPALFLSGGDSDYVQDAHRDRIRALFPKARFATIPGTGHWLHAEKPREVEATVRAFLDA